MKKKCAKCGNEIKDEDYMTIENYKKEVIFCKKCGDIYEKAEEQIKKNRKILDDYWKFL